MSPKLAKWIRIFTLPQVMALIAIALLWGDYLPGHGWFAALALTGLPLLSYAVWRAVPGLYAKGRDTQRKLAVIFSVSGYAFGLLLSLAEGGGGPSCSSIWPMPSPGCWWRYRPSASAPGPADTPPGRRGR